MCDRDIDYLAKKIEIYKSDLDFLIKQIKESCEDAEKERATSYLSAYATLAGTMSHVVRQLEKFTKMEVDNA